MNVLEVGFNERKFHVSQLSTLLTLECFSLDYSYVVLKVFKSTGQPFLPLLLQAQLEHDLKFQAAAAQQQELRH